MTTEPNNNHINKKIQGSMDANDLVFIKNSNGEYSGGGFSINSALMKRGIAPMTTMSGGATNGESVSDLFNHMVVPAGLMGPSLSLKHNITGGNYLTDDDDTIMDDDDTIMDDDDTIMDDDDTIIDDDDIIIDNTAMEDNEYDSKSDNNEYDDLGDDFEFEFDDSSEDENFDEDSDEDNLDDFSLDSEEKRLNNQNAIVPDYLFEELFKLSVYENPIERNDVLNENNNNNNNNTSNSKGGKIVHKNKKRHNLTRHKSKKLVQGRKTRKR